MAKTNEKALNAFLFKIWDINEKLEILQQYMGNHMDCDSEEIHWGHVGSADHIVELLDELIEFLGINKGAKR